MLSVVLLCLFFGLTGFCNSQSNCSILRIAVNVIPGVPVAILFIFSAKKMYYIHHILLIIMWLFFSYSVWADFYDRIVYSLYLDELKVMNNCERILYFSAFIILPVAIYMVRKSKAGYNS